jgi:hypothetical protein
MIMRLVTQASEFLNLHNWLDEFAEGWQHYGIASDTRRQYEITCHRILRGDIEDHMVAHLVYIPTAEQAMLVKLTWPDSRVTPR